MSFMGSTALLLIAHGSRNPAANRELFDLADRLRQAGRYRIVQAAFLELADPDIAEGGGRCVTGGADRVLMIPYLLSAGVHALGDLASARDDLAGRFPAVEFRLGPPLGPHPLLDELVRLRVADLDGASEAPR